MNTNDNATARPWTIEDWILETDRLSGEITKLVNEHAALTKAAEALEKVYAAMVCNREFCLPFKGEDGWTYSPEAKARMALAELARVRESGVAK